MRKPILVAAIFIGCSAYAMFFSRDGKMYSPTWLLATLSIACLLWWLRTHRRIAWWAWMAAGLAAGGFHTVTLLLLPLAPLYMLARRQHHWKHSVPKTTATVATRMIRIASFRIWFSSLKVCGTATMYDYDKRIVGVAM